MLDSRAYTILLQKCGTVQNILRDDHPLSIEEDKDQMCISEQLNPIAV